MMATFYEIRDAAPTLHDIQSSSRDRGLHPSGHGSWWERMRRRLDGFVKKISFAVLVIVLIGPTEGKVAMTGATENLTLRPMDTCLQADSFLEWVEPANALEGQGSCLLCICKDHGSALCWQRDQRHCEKNHLRKVHRSKRAKRNSFFNSLLKPVIEAGNENKYKTGKCKPFQDSYSEGCPPDDWCAGCTVCDCNAKGNWDCHLLSFCGDKAKVFQKNNMLKHKTKPAQMKNSVTTKRQITTKPKVVKRGAPKNIMTSNTRKSANKPSPQPKPKPKPKRSTQQKLQPPDIQFSDNVLAQKVFKRVMAAIQEMTHRKYGLRADAKRVTTTKKPDQKFKKITKKPSPQKIKTAFKRVRYIRKPKPEPKPKHRPQPTRKPVTKRQQSVLKTTVSPTNAIKSIREKKLREEIDKIMKKAVAKIHKQRRKRDVMDHDTPTTEANNATIVSTSPSMATTSKPQKITSPTTASYKTKEDNFTQSTSQDSSYSYSESDKNTTDVQRVQTKDYYNNIDAGVKIIVTTEAYIVSTNTNKEIDKYSDVNMLQSENIQNETNENVEVSTIAVTDQIADPNTNLATEKYSQITKVLLVAATDKLVLTSIETTPDKNSIKTEGNIHMKSHYASDYGYDVRKVLSANNYSVITDKKNESNVLNDDVTKIVSTILPDMLNYSKSTTVTSPTKQTHLSKDYNIGNVSHINGIKSLQQDLGFHLPVTKQVYSKFIPNFSGKSYFQKLFRYIFSKTKEERKNMRKPFLENEYNSKLNILRAVYENVGPFNVSRDNTFFLKTLLKALCAESNKILKAVHIIKSLLYLLDMPYIKPNKVVANSDKYKSKITYDNDVVEHRRGDQTMRIDFIRKNTDMFVDLVGNFSSTLTTLIDTLTSDNTTKHRRLQVREDVDPVKLKVKNIFRNIKTVIDDHDQAENALISILNNKLTKKQRNQVLHLIYKNSDTMDHYKYRVLEILGKLKIILNRIEMLRTEKHRKEKLEYEKRLEDMKKGKEIEQRNLLNELEKIKQKLDAKKKEIDGVQVWNMGRPQRRRKRQLRDNDALYQYLLMVMEFILKQVSVTSPAPSENDGIELLIEAIQKAPNIEPIRIPRKTYLNPNVSQKSKKELKEFLQKLILSARQKKVRNTIVKNIPMKKKDQIEINKNNSQNMALQKQNMQYLGNENLQYNKTENVNGDKSKSLNAAKIQYYEDDDSDDDDTYYENDGKLKNKDEKNQNPDEIKKVKDELIQLNAEDSNNFSLGKIKGKTVFKRVSFINETKKDDTINLQNETSRPKFVDVTTVKIKSDYKKFIVDNVKTEEELDNKGVATKAFDFDKNSYGTSPPPTDVNCSDRNNTTKDPTNKLELYDNKEHRHLSKPKIIWIAETTTENNVQTDNALHATTTDNDIVRSLSSTSLTPPSSANSAPLPVIKPAKKSTTKAMRKFKMKSRPQQILYLKEKNLLHSLDYITTDSASSTEESEDIEY